MAFDVHQVPGRIRFKIPGLRDDAALITELPRALRAYDGVERVDVRPASNSLIVHYDPERVEVRELAGSINSGLATGTHANGAKSPVRPFEGRLADEKIIRASLEHVGAVFAQTAFKVALEQAVRGSLTLMFRR
jgi:hypothetical protein